MVIRRLGEGGMVGDWEKKVLELAGKQFNLITSKQALQLGMTRKMLRARVERGCWQRLSVRVFAAGPTTPTLEQKEYGALLAAGEGAALARLSAAWRLKLDVKRPTTVQLVVPRGRALLLESSYEVVRSRNLRDDDITARKDVRITRMGRTLLDLAASLDRHALKPILDSALRLSRENLSWCWTALQHHNRGHEGAARLRAMLAGYRLDDEVPDSLLESIAQELCFVSGRRPFLHYAIADGDQFVAEVDLAWPDVKLAVELDGYAYHSARNAFDADRERDRRCAILDWQVHRFVWRDVHLSRDTFRSEVIRLYDVRKNRGAFPSAAPEIAAPN